MVVLSNSKVAYNDKIPHRISFYPRWCPLSMTMPAILLYYYMTACHPTHREPQKCTVVTPQPIKSICAAIPHSAICQVADRASVSPARVRWRFYAGIARVRRHTGTITVMLLMSMLQ